MTKWLGLVYFGRMLDKIRLKAAGRLPADYNVGTKEWYDFDSRCTRFLKVKYRPLKIRTLREDLMRRFSTGASKTVGSRARRISRFGIRS